MGFEGLRKRRNIGPSFALPIAAMQKVILRLAGSIRQRDRRSLHGIPYSVKMMCIEKYTREEVDSLLTFLDPLNEYDREEVITARCAGTDVDSRSSVRRLIDENYFLDPWYSKTALAGKVQLSSILLSAMKDEEFDFEWLTSDADGTFLLPACFGTGRAKMLYQEIYRAAFDHWGKELQEAGLLLPPPSELGIPALN